MAMSEQLRLLLEDFWNNNQELIELSIDALASSPLAGDDEKSSFQKLAKDIKSLSGKGKDNTHYSINGKGDFGKGPLVFEIIKRYVDQKGFIDVSDLQQVFPYSLRGKTNVLGNKVVIGPEDYDKDVKGNPSRDWRWKELVKDSKVCYVNGMWGDRDAMIKLIENFKTIKELSGITIEELPSKNS